MRLEILLSFVILLLVLDLSSAKPCQHAIASESDTHKTKRRQERMNYIKRRRLYNSDHSFNNEARKIISDPNQINLTHVPKKLRSKYLSNAAQLEKSNLDTLKDIKMRIQAAHAEEDLKIKTMLQREREILEYKHKIRHYIPASDIENELWQDQRREKNNDKIRRRMTEINLKRLGIILDQPEELNLNSQ